MLSYEPKRYWKQKFQLFTGSVAAGDTSAAIIVQIQYNNLTIHAHETSNSYSALCTLVEQEWPLLTAFDYVFQIHVEHDNVQFDSEVCSNCWQATLANCAMLIRICAHHQAGWQSLQQKRQGDNGVTKLKVCSSAKGFSSYTNYSDPYIR